MDTAYCLYFYRRHIDVKQTINPVKSFLREFFNPPKTLLLLKIPPYSSLIMPTLVFPWQKLLKNPKCTLFGAACKPLHAAHYGFYLVSAISTKQHEIAPAVIVPVTV